MRNEQLNIENQAKKNNYALGINGLMIEYTFGILEPYLRGEVLEMGPADGTMTDKIIKQIERFTVVEGAQYFADKLKMKYPLLDINCSLFEDFEPTKKFDTIIMGHILEHVENPVAILQKTKSWLNKDGIIFAAVPNAHSIHRQAAVIMGLSDKENSISELDIQHGHRRVYNFNEFKQDFIKAGLNIKKSGGYWLKPLSNKQIEDTWTREMISAFFKLGEQYPDIVAEMYVVAGI